MAVLLSDISKTGIMHKIARLYGYGNSRLALEAVGWAQDEEYQVVRNDRVIPGVKVRFAHETRRYQLEGKQ